MKSDTVEGRSSFLPCLRQVILSKKAATAATAFLHMLPEIVYAVTSIYANSLHFY